MFVRPVLCIQRPVDPASRVNFRRERREAPDYFSRQSSGANFPYGAFELTHVFR
jgi:hypothetical protein